MDLLEAAPSLWLPDYMVHRVLQPPLWMLADEASVAHLVAPVTQALPRLYRVYSGRSWSLRCSFFLHIQNPAQLSWLFSVLFQCHCCCLPQPHPPLHPQQTKVCPSEVLCAVLTAVNAQGFMLYFGGEEIPPIQVCEVFFFSVWSQLSWSSRCLKTHLKSCFEVHFCRFKQFYFGVECLFFAFILVLKLRFLNKAWLTNITWSRGTEWIAGLAGLLLI